MHVVSRVVCAGVALLALTTSRAARADQVILADVSWSHPTDTASDSHYHIPPAAGTPANWKSPVDYTQGSVYFALDVKTKPAGDAPTKFQVCFEGTPSYACGDQSPTYTTTGHYTWMTPFTNFYQYSMVDWSKSVGMLALIVKDDMNNKPAGDPKYVPTDLHVVIVMLSKGATYVPVNSNGGMGGSGGRNAAGAGGMAGRGGRGGTAGSAGKPAADGGHAGSVDAGTHTDVDASRPDASTGTAGTSSAAAAGAAGTSASGSPQTTTGNAGSAAIHRVMPKPGSNCSAAGGVLGNAWFSALVAGLLLARRRRLRD